MPHVIHHQENAIKTEMRYHYTLIRMAKMRTLTMPSAGEGVEQHDFSFTAGRSAKWYSHFDTLAVSYKIKHTPPR